MSLRIFRVHALLSGTAAIALAVLGGCDPSDPCDPGNYEEHGACYPLPSDSGSGVTPDASDEDAGDDDAGEEPPVSGDPYAGFGDACAQPSDCPSGLVCGAPELAYCTRTNCMDEAAACPPGWTCFDTTGLSPDPSVTSICLNL